MKNVLITGGLGYIGSHISLLLLQNGYNVFVVDNLSNSSLYDKTKIEFLAKRELHFYNFDLHNAEKLAFILKENKIDSVIHLAGLKSVYESKLYEEKYYDSIFTMSCKVIDAVKKAGVKKLIFSSSATVYGNSEIFPLEETFTARPQSPYAIFKNQVEKLIEKNARQGYFKAIIFRNFNILGADISGLIGDKPTNNYSNVIKNISDAYLSKNKTFVIAGHDRNTEDGTAMRDYVHVDDVARANFLALKNFGNITDCEIINLCSEKPVSVLNLFNIFNNLTGNKMQCAFKEKPQNDIDIVYGSNQKAFELLGWRPEKNETDMVKSHINFIKKNQDYFTEQKEF